MASLQALLTEQQGDAICLDVAGLADGSEVLRRIIVRNAPRDDVMNGKPSSRFSAALGTPISVALQDETPQPEPSMCAKALSYRVPALFAKKGAVLVAAGVRAGFGLRNPRPDDLVGRATDHALDSDPIPCQPRALRAAKARPLFSHARVYIKRLLTGITNQMHRATAAWVGALSGAEPCTGRHGLLEYRKRLGAISAFQYGIGLRLSATQAHALVRTEPNSIWAMLSALAPYMGGGTRENLAALDTGYVDGGGVHSSIITQGGYHGNLS